MEVLEDNMSIFAQSGSGWTLDENQASILEMVDYEPIDGSSYLELPKDVYHYKAVINVKNEDQQCFKWSILAALHPQTTNPQRVSKYEPFKDELHFEGIEFPINIDQIPQVEKQNPGLSVTVIGIAKEKTKKVQGKSVKGSVFMPLREPDKQLEKHVVLLFPCEKEESHYAWIKNLNRLLSRTKSYGGQTYFCERCFQGFIRPDLLSNHISNCQHFPIQATTVVDQEISFKNWSKTEETLFRIYADFECVLHVCEEEDTYGKTVKMQRHVPCGFEWVLVSDHPELDLRSKLYRPSPAAGGSLQETSQRVVDELILSVKELENELLPYQLQVKPMDLTEEGEAAFQAATHCYMCEVPFYEDEGKWHKVRNHNHATGD